MPVRKRSVMYPRARAESSYGAKHGAVAPAGLSGTRRPSSSCWPSMTEICEKLTFEPFAPVAVIISKLFVGRAMRWPDGRHAPLTW